MIVERHECAWLSGLRRGGTRRRSRRWARCRCVPPTYYFLLTYLLTYYLLLTTYYLLLTTYYLLLTTYDLRLTTYDLLLTTYYLAQEDYAREDLDLWSWGELSAAEMATMARGGNDRCREFLEAKGVPRRVWLALALPLRYQTPAADL